MFFNSWDAVLRVVIMGLLAYISLIVLLRTSGKRTLSKMNMFDFVITVALGSAFSTITLSSDIALAEGVTALALLIYLQFAVAWLSVRFVPFRQIIKGEPSLLFYQGEFLWQVMRRERITKEEVHAAARSNGLANTEDAFAVILETDGSINVLPKGNYDAAGVLQDVGGA
jgi:uncharacterized membrane protein YcaP (DUF421 family)